MFKNVLFSSLVILSFNGCTSIITAPIEIVGAVAGAAIDVTSATVRAVAGSDDDEKKKD
ncbi:MAG: hypothetical protein IE881_00075 [Epsilonproteobacteria bacterium]|jgi:uncharacterized protein YceK|nr:hypothetical protein [Campylobacterota bacterium]